MTRVSENSNKAALNFAVGKAKEKLEDLQIKGTSLKRVTKPSDDPVSNVEALAIGSTSISNKQFLRNSDHALLQLNATEQALDQLSEIMLKAKDIAIQQSSDFYDVATRRNVANEIIQLKNQMLSIANKRIGNRHIFAGFDTLKPPFNIEGDYFGDDGKIKVEVSKDFFVQINLNGREVFFADDSKSNQNINSIEFQRTLASETPDKEFHKRENLFGLLKMLTNGLENGDSNLIQDLLEKFDDAQSRIITLRTRVGSIVNSIMTSRAQLESENVDLEAHKSKLIDADVAELFSDITKQQQVLKTTYQSGQAILSQSLLDFLR